MFFFWSRFDWIWLTNSRHLSSAASRRQHARKIREGWSEFHDLPRRPEKAGGGYFAELSLDLGKRAGVSASVLLMAAAALPWGREASATDASGALPWQTVISRIVRAAWPRRGEAQAGAMAVVTGSLRCCLRPEPQHTIAGWQVGLTTFVCGPPVRGLAGFRVPCCLISALLQKDHSKQFSMSNDRRR